MHSTIAQELNQAQQHLEETVTETEEEANVEEKAAEDHDEWMLLCHLNPRFTDNDTIQDVSVHWSEPA